MSAGDSYLIFGGSDFTSSATYLGTLRLDGSGLLLKLTTLADNRLLGIETIDITGSGNITLTLNQREVLNLSDESNTLVVPCNVGDLRLRQLEPAANRDDHRGR